MRHGKGVHKYCDGEVYDGDWKDDNRHGKETIAHPDGVTYEGDWENDKII